MPVFNAGEYLPAAIESILQQTYTNFELILVNDASTDNSANIVTSYRDPRVITIRNERNLGPAQSRNKAIEIARGAYIALMDADDLSDRRRLASQVSFLKANPGIALVATWGKVIDESAKTVKQVRLPMNPFLLRWRLLLNNKLIHSSVMFPAQILKDLGGYDRAFPYAEDYELYSRIILDHQVAVIPDLLVRWRRHEKGLSSMQSENLELAANRIAARNVQSIMRKRFSEAQVKLLRDILNLRPVPKQSECGTCAALLCNLFAAAVARWNPSGEGLLAMSRDCSRSLVGIASLSSEADRWSSFEIMKKAARMDLKSLLRLPAWKCLTKIIIGPHLSTALR